MLAHRICTGWKTDYRFSYLFFPLRGKWVENAMIWERHRACHTYAE